ncbi:MAG: DNA phosphorothioation-associated putative methyltransferase, partial [Pseudomonadales bacterium]
MRPPGKTVVDEFYIHLSALEHVQNDDARRTIERAVSCLPNSGDLEPNVAKFNLRTGRVSLLAYLDFFDSPFPVLAAAWCFPPGANTHTSFRRYDDSLNPPILHRKELLLPFSQPNHARWAALTATAESLGLFDDVATIGFHLNWQRLIASKGYRLLGDEFVPLGNELVAADDCLEQADFAKPVQRHLTALSRSSLSAPVQLLIRHRLLTSGKAFFDYGCGRGGDVAALCSEGYDAKGWDPHYFPEASIVPSDIVNFGFVANVIEDPAERIEALTNAFRLARTAMSVGVMLYGADTPGRPFGDGFLTSRNTFQKYFSQAELKDYLEQVLHRDAFMVGPGVAFIFANNEAEQRFISERYRSRGVANRLLAARVQRVRPVREPAPIREPKPARPARASQYSRAAQQLTAVRPLLDKLWATTLDLGRFPAPEELESLIEVNEQIGSLTKALRLIARHYDQNLLVSAARTRSDDVRMFMATQLFSKRAAYRQLEPCLQRDIKAFFGDYKAAQDAGLNLLIDAADPAKILAACKDAATRGLGWLDAEHSLQLHTSMVERLPAILRAYVACGLILWDSLSEVQLVKIHISSGKLTLMEFDGFDDSPTPLLRRRIKVQVRKLDYDVYEYGSATYPKPALYHKSRYLHEDYPGYAEQLAFDEALERVGILQEGEHGPPPARLVEMLDARRLTISGMRLVRSTTIPDLDSPCGANLTYRALIECGETRHRLGIPNLPLRHDTYNALHDLATE